MPCVPEASAARSAAAGPFSRAGIGWARKTTNAPSAAMAPRAKGMKGELRRLIARPPWDVG